jgi:hypothetical protein
MAPPRQFAGSSAPSKHSPRRQFKSSSGRRRVCSSRSRIGIVSTLDCVSVMLLKRFAKQVKQIIVEKIARTFRPINPLFLPAIVPRIIQSPPRSDNTIPSELEDEMPSLNVFSAKLQANRERCRVAVGRLRRSQHESITTTAKDPVMMISRGALSIRGIR